MQYVPCKENKIFKAKKWKNNTKMKKVKSIRSYVWHSWLTEINGNPLMCYFENYTKYLKNQKLLRLRLVLLNFVTTVCLIFHCVGSFGISSSLINLWTRLKLQKVRTVRNLFITRMKMFKILPSVDQYI